MSDGAREEEEEDEKEDVETRPKEGAFPPSLRDWKTLAWTDMIGQGKISTLNSGLHRYRKLIFYPCQSRVRHYFIQALVE